MSLVNAASIDKNKKCYTILFLTKWYPTNDDPQLGVFVRKHAQAVAEYCKVTLLFVYGDEHLSKRYQRKMSRVNGLNEVIIYYKKSNSAFINFFRYLIANYLGIKKIQRLEKIDLVHVNVLNRPGLIACILKKMKGIPYVITEHWTGYVSGKYQKSNWLKKWFTKRIIKNASAVTTVSHSLRNKMLRLGLKNTYFVVPNIIENVALEPVKHSKIKILSIADLVDAHKNISGIIKVISLITKENQEIEYHIIGDGPDKMMLKQLSDKLGLSNTFVFFHGRQTNKFVYKVLKQIDFVVINSNFETFSVVAAEALVNGKPVVATRCGGPEEFITAETGILIEPNNQRQLHDAIVQMIAEYKNYDPEKLNNYITEKFNYSVIGKQFYELYQSILS
jgi:glycosyltransferase involved in cell wall biosynthesis